MKTFIFIAWYLLLGSLFVEAKMNSPVKPRILVSTDIGGTDPDDNQSMIHLLMYNDCFEIEGLVSSPSYGNGSKEEIMRMIDLYAADYDKLKAGNKNLMSPESLRGLCKQGRRGLASYQGYDEPTEGSDWIVRCARKECDRPLYVLVWGSLEDVAQALHDAPDIVPRIRVYWIGGPNKKWGVNSYAYIAKHFPDLWMIENNASYRGFISDSRKTDQFNKGYYDHAIKGAGHLGEAFAGYYGGTVKMGDTPSLLYMMTGHPENPCAEGWGGCFEKMAISPYRLFHGNTSVKDTVPVYSVMEFHFTGPLKEDKEIGHTCFSMCIDKQHWDGVYLGEGIYGVRYSPKAPGVLTYETNSDLKELNGLKGTFVVGIQWPGKVTVEGYRLGNNWFTDKQDPALFDGIWQGCKTVSKWRKEVLADWSLRWEWLK